jgi:hypothetical protein
MHMIHSISLLCCCFSLWLSFYSRFTMHHNYLQGIWSNSLPFLLGKDNIFVKMHLVNYLLIVCLSLIYKKNYVFFTHPFIFILLLPSLVFLKSPPCISFQNTRETLTPISPAHVLSSSK